MPGPQRLLRPRLFLAGLFVCRRSSIQPWGAVFGKSEGNYTAASRSTTEPTSWRIGAW